MNCHTEDDMERIVQRRFLIIIVTGLLAAVVLSACGQAPQASGKDTGTSSQAMAPMAWLPKAVQDAPTRVGSAYQFAVANPDALKNVPCYCGCGAVGHTSNLSCYVQERKPGGEIVFADHALGCSHCVDISQDVMRMTGAGESPAAIRAAIVATYSKFGPGNQ